METSRSQKLDELLEKWQIDAKLDKFIKDGIICPQKYEESKVKVLFILQESDEKGGKATGVTDQREWYRSLVNGIKDDGPKLRTKLGRIYRIIANEELEGSSESDKDAKAVENIAVINLNKSGSSTNSSAMLAKRVEEFTKKNSVFLKEQIDLIDPEYIVCLGTFDLAVKYVIDLQDEKPQKRYPWKKLPKVKVEGSKVGGLNEVKYLLKNRVTVIRMFHPSPSHLNTHTQYFLNEDKVKKYGEEFRLRYTAVEIAKKSKLK